ncbi:MAG: flippase [Bacteroidia bacterium]|nr:flippase [Bacteroidia bacterium]
MAERGFFRDVISVMNTNTFTTIIRFVIGIMIARALGPAGKGLYAAILVVPNMIFSITELGVKRATIYHIGEKIYPPEQVIGVLLFFMLITSTLGIIISAGVYHFMNNPNITLPLVMISLLGIPAQLITKYTNGIFIGKEQYRISNFLRYLPIILNLLFIVIFVILIKWYVLGALLAILVANVLTAVYSFDLILKNHRLKIQFDIKIFKSIIQLGAVYAIAMFLVKLNFRIDVLIMQSLTSLKEVGFYNQGVTVAEGWQAPFAIGAVVLSTSANSGNQEVVNNQVAKLFRLTLLMVIIASAFIFFASPLLVPLIYGRNFTPSVQITQYIIPAIVIVILAKILASRLAGLKKTYIVIFVHLPAVIINIIFNLMLIPKYGAMGAVIATNISYSFMAIGILVIYSRVIHRPVSDIFRYRKSDFDFIPELKPVLLRLTGLKKPESKHFKKYGNREAEKKNFEEDFFPDSQEY